MYKLPATLTDDINYVDTLIREYKAGQLDEARFKAVRVPMGIYEQRKNGTYMARIRCTGGFISPRQLMVLAQVARSAGIPYLHITTRQEIQLHYVPLEQMKEILITLQTAGLGTKGGGGNTIRNILVDIRAGIDAEETFDPYPYAVDLTSFLLTQNDSFTLPRKLKIAFNISEEEADFARINDLGFIPRIVNGERGFKVYLGGSVASKPTLGWLAYDFIPESDLLRVAVAAKRFFSENGNRKNRHKARIRHIFYKSGAEETLTLFRKYVEEARSETSLLYQPRTIPFTYPVPEKPSSLIPEEETFIRWKEQYTVPQKQPGRYAVIFPVLQGNISPDILERLGHYISKFGEDTIRFTTRQHIQLRNIPEEFLPEVWFELRSLQTEISRSRLINEIISCTGADTCRLGICFSKGATKAIREKLIKSDLPLDQFGPARINISGCSNSCAQQVWADLGFAGRVARNDRMYPAYTVYAKTEGKHVLGQSLGSISARDLPDFCVALFRDYLNKKEIFPTFSDYITQEGREYIGELLKQFADVPSFAEDKNYYFDWGAEEIFSVSERGKAECSAGLFDMIDIDKDIIEKSRKELDTLTDPKRINLFLLDIALSASRMLLITKGAEPRTTAESFDLFRQLFIEEGLIDKRHLSLLEEAKENKNLITRQQEVLQLASDVIDLYGSMDDSLQFKSPAGKSQVQPEKTFNEEKKTTPAGKVVKDFRGVACPMNFVKTKLALAPLTGGSLLEIWLDDGAPIENVPGSVRNEGHEILEVNREGDFWKVLIRKAR